MKTVALLAVLTIACAHAGARTTSGPTKTVVLSLREIDCQSCVQAVTRLLQAKEGVVEARFDQAKAEVTAVYEPSRTTPERLAGAVRDAGYVAELGAGRGAYRADVRFPASADVQWISAAGEDVSIDAHRAAGKVTVVDFYARWCGPCRDVDREMAAILERDASVALRKVNVVAWDSPVAKRYLAGVPSLPYVVVLAPGGAKVRAIAGLDLPGLRRAIAEAKTR